MYFERSLSLLDGLLARQRKISAYLRSLHKERAAKWFPSREPVEPGDLCDLGEAMEKLAAARKEADARGIHPLDDEYPEIVDFMYEKGSRK